MESNCSSAVLNASGHYVCVCLRMTHTELVSAITCLNIRTLKDLRLQTGAGDGCTACHRRLRHYLGPVAEEGVS
jgi:bacterioferritin-associated ferredoxin